MNNESQPLISVIVPVYNGEKFLADTLRAIFAQTYVTFEVIVIDDGSTDTSADIVRSFEGARVKHQENQGHAAARNTGIGLANGDLLAFCDADDIWTADKLQRQAGLLEVHPEVHFVLGRMETLLEPGVEWPKNWNREHYANQPVAFIPSALLARREAFEAIGMFDPLYKIGSDSDWFFRARDAGLKWLPVDDVILFRRVHAQNQSHDSRNLNRELLRVVRASLNRRNVDGSPS